jgi:GNAT superfamily N-acetyltransferase
MSTDELLHIRYSLERALSGEPDDSQLDVWWAMLRRGVTGTDDITWVEIGMATLYGLDPYRNSLVGESPFDVADAHSADVAHYYEHVFDARGELLADVVELFEWPPNCALFLDDVRVDPEFRRRGYGSLLVADALLTLATHGTAVFAHPGPTDLGSGSEDEVSRLRSETQNTRFLGALGFAPFRDRLWTLDLATEAAIERLAAIRRGGPA